MSLSLAFLPGPRQGFPRPLHSPNPKCPASFSLVLLLCTKFQARHPKFFLPQGPTSFLWYSADKWVPFLLGSCSSYLPVVCRPAWTHAPTLGFPLPRVASALFPCRPEPSPGSQLSPYPSHPGRGWPLYTKPELFRQSAPECR